jgi:MFS family permease
MGRSSITVAMRDALPAEIAREDGPDWLVVGLLLTGTFMAVLDFFIVNVAIPDLQRDLSASASQIQFVVAGYALAYGSALIVGSRFGDIFGRRRMFICGMILFTAASAACGLAPDARIVIVARIV